MSLPEVLIALQGHVVQVFLAVEEFEFEFSSFTLGGLPHFLLTWVVSIDFVLCT